MTDTQGETSPYLAVPMDFSFAEAAGAEWRAARHPAIEERDLELATASHGQMRATELRATAAGVLDGWERAGDAVFLFFYVIEGKVRFTMSDGDVVTLERREVVHQPFLAAVQRAEFSADFLAAEVVVPGDGSGIEPVPLLDMKPKPHEGPFEHAVVRNREHLYIRGDGPRAFFTYRDLGAAAETDRRIQIHDGDGAKQPMKGGTGWHDHSMSQFFLVLDGSATIAVDGKGEFDMRPGDAMTLGAGMKHNVSAYSEGYNVFEICLPADYLTTDRDPPVG